jgi:alkanal monooxygenase alpha chain
MVGYQGGNDGMKVGLFLTTAHFPDMSQEEIFDNTTDYALEAEALGYDDVWVLEHHFTRFGLCAHPLTMAGYLLGKTSRLRVGSAVSVLPLYHPIQLAEQVAMLDQMSNGRFDFGVGRGLFQKDFEVFGADPAKSHLVMREWIDIIKRAWTEEVVEAHSDLIDFPAVPLYPTPRTKPHPPISVVCESTTSTEWVASQGYPMILSWWLEREAIRSQVELYNEVSEAHGHDPDDADHVLSAIAFVGDSHEEAKAAVRDNITWWRGVGRDAAFKFEQLRKLDNYKAFFRQWEDEILKGGGDADEGLRASVEHLLDLNIIGTPEQCIERIEELADSTGVRHIVLGFEGVADRERVLESMRRFAHEVLPAIHDLGAVPAGRGA